MSEQIPELVMTRIIDAPRELVFAAWTKPEHFRHWFCPPGFETVLCEIDARAGGGFRIHWRDQNGQIHPNKGTFKQVMPNDRLVYDDAFDDDRPENDPIEITIELVAEGQQTRMTTISRFPSKAQYEKIMAMGAQEGWAMFLDQLEAYTRTLKHA